MRWFLKGIISVQVIMWVAIIAGVIYFGPTVGEAISDGFYGAVDRIDHAIGYEAK